jgi:hypothetical protein
MGLLLRLIVALENIAQIQQKRLVTEQATLVALQSIEKQLKPPELPAVQLLFKLGTPK